MNKKGKIIGLALVAIMVVSLFAVAIPSITARPNGDGKPDLIITDIKVVGNRIHYTIENIGTADAPKSYTGLWVDGKYGARDRVDPLGEGEESDEVFARENYEGGVIRVCADYRDKIDESNENNNCRTGPLPPPEKSDLTVVEKTETVVDSTFKVTYVVGNFGTANAGESVACVYINGVHQVDKDVTVSALAAGDCSGPITVGPFNCSCGGEINVTVCADNYNAVDESDETNNCLTNYDVECPCPDLIIIDKDETFNETANTFNVTFKVKNNGNAAAVNTSKACIYIDGDHQTGKDVNVSALAKGAVEPFDVGPFDCPPCGETKEVKVCADNYDNVSESNETNNCMVNTVECPCPDLIIIEKDETFNTTANTFNVTFKVKNNGNADVVNTSKACIYIDSVHQAGKDVNVSALAKGAVEPFDVGPFDCPPCGETKEVKVCADNYGNVSESDETNNCAVNTVVC
jgi:subtilase family serine protease